MADRTIKVFTSVASGATSNTDSAAPPNGMKIILTKCGASDINTGDNKSSVFQLLWGNIGSFTTVFAFALTGNVYEFEVTEEFIGDGSKFFRLVRINNSTSAKNLAMWIKGYDS